MAALQAHQGAFQMDFGFPVLEGGYRPPKPKRRRRRQVVEPDEHTIQLTLDLLLDTLVGSSDEVTWDVEQIKGLHAFLLERSLAVLADTRTSTATVKEILAWLCALPANREAMGFSFILCCWLSGYDADELREQTIYEVTRLRGIHVHAA